MSFVIIALEGCPHSERCAKVFKDMPNLNHKVHWVNPKDKSKHKIGKKQTFPQVSYVVKNQKGTKEVYIGGASEMDNLLEARDCIKKNNLDVSTILPLLELIKHS